MSDRTATIFRKTNETDIEVSINLDCQPGSASPQVINVSTGIGFLDHVCSLPKETLSRTHSERSTRIIDVPRPCEAQRNVSHAQGQG